jgi:hypothetical protein
MVLLNGVNLLYLEKYIYENYSPKSMMYQGLLTGPGLNGTYFKGKMSSRVPKGHKLRVAISNLLVATLAKRLDPLLP